MNKRKIYIDVLLKDNMIMSYHISGNERTMPHDYYKDFYYSGYNMENCDKEFEVKGIAVEFIDNKNEESSELNDFIFEVIARDFFKRWKVHPEHFGSAAYIDYNSINELVVPIKDNKLNDIVEKAIKEYINSNKDNIEIHINKKEDKMNNIDNFLKELTELSKKYNIYIESDDGIVLTDYKNKLQYADLHYDNKYEYYIDTCYKYYGDD